MATKTVLEVIQATTGYFEKNGVESARLNIELLLAQVLGMKRMELYLQFDRPLAAHELEPLRGLVKRRAEGEPLQHLLGTVEFLGQTFLCDQRALIPRPETEQLCELLLGRYRPEGFAGRLVDVGTGSGVIALSLARSWPNAAVEAVDLSAAALALAQANGQKLGLAERVRFYEGDLLAASEGEFGLVVANLPYLGEGELAGLAREVRRDPRSALVGGVSGTEAIERLIAEAAPVLRGALALEIGLGQAEAIERKLREHNFQDIQIVADYQGVQRFVFATHG